MIVSILNKGQYFIIVSILNKGQYFIIVSIFNLGHHKPPYFYGQYTCTESLVEGGGPTFFESLRKINWLVFQQSKDLKRNLKHDFASL